MGAVSMVINKELTAVTHLKSWPIGIKGLEDWHRNLTFVHVDPHIPITDLQVLLNLAIKFLDEIEQHAYLRSFLTHNWEQCQAKYRIKHAHDNHF